MLMYFYSLNGFTLPLIDSWWNILIDSLWNIQLLMGCTHLVRKDMDVNNERLYPIYTN